MFYFHHQSINLSQALIQSNMQVEAELASLHKKLQSGWSSWTASASMSKSAVIDEFILSYDKFEKKIKMRVLISLLGMDHSKKMENMKQILVLLEMASFDTSDQWIPITAGLVYKKLFENRSDKRIESAAESKMNETVETILSRVTTYVTEHLETDTTEDLSYYFEPYELKYLSDIKIIKANKYSEVTSSSQNQHFTYVGRPPNFLAREVAKLNAKTSAISTTTSSSSSSSSSSALSSGTKSSINANASSMINLGSTASHHNSTSKPGFLSNSISSSSNSKNTSAGVEARAGASSSIFRSTREHTISGSKLQSGSGSIKTLSLEDVKKRRQEPAVLILEAPTSTLTATTTSKEVTLSKVDDVVDGGKKSSAASKKRKQISEEKDTPVIEPTNTVENESTATATATATIADDIDVDGNSDAIGITNEDSQLNESVDNTTTVIEEPNKRLIPRKKRKQQPSDTDTPTVNNTVILPIESVTTDSVNNAISTQVTTAATNDMTILKETTSTNIPTIHNESSIIIKTEPSSSSSSSSSSLPSSNMISFNTAELFQSSKLLTEPDRQVIAKFVSQDPQAAAKWPTMKIKLNESFQTLVNGQRVKETEMLELNFRENKWNKLIKRKDL